MLFKEDPLEDAVVIGVEPESLEIGFEPSAPVQWHSLEVKERVLHVLREWGVTAELNTLKFICVYRI